jgi:hypothetical protein
VWGEGGAGPFAHHQSQITSKIRDQSLIVLLAYVDTRAWRARIPDDVRGQVPGAIKRLFPMESRIYDFIASERKNSKFLYI